MATGNGDAGKVKTARYLSHFLMRKTPEPAPDGSEARASASGSSRRDSVSQGNVNTSNWSVIASPPCLVDPPGK